MNKGVIFLIKFYRQVSFLVPKSCKFYPSCSQYAEQAFYKYSFFKALGLTLRRIVRCNPLTQGGVDTLK
jgi:hypothetical protein